MLALSWLALAGAVELADLDEGTTWREVRTARTDIGTVTVRSRRFGTVVCASGQARVAPSPEALATVTDDLASAPRWSSTPLARSEEVWRSGASYRLFQVYDSPGWTLAADRYWLIEGHTAELPDGRTFWWEGLPAAGLADGLEGAIEPPVNLGRWRFVRDGEATLLDYAACADFGGALPASIQQWVTTQQVPTVIEELVREASRR